MPHNPDLPGVDNNFFSRSIINLFRGRPYETPAEGAFQGFFMVGIASAWATVLTGKDSPSNVVAWLIIATSIYGAARGYANQQETNRQRVTLR